MAGAPSNGLKSALFLESGGGRGGSTHFLYDLVRSLDPTWRAPVVCFYFRNDGPDTRRIRSLGVPVEFLSDRPEPVEYVPFQFLLGRSRWRWWHAIKVVLRFGLRTILYDLPQLWRLHSILQRQRVDLIVLNNDVHYHVVGALAAKLTRTPCVCRKAGGIGEAPRLRVLLTPWVDAFIAISRATERDQLATCPSTRKLVTIPEGVDLRRFSPRTKSEGLLAELRIPAGNKVLGCVARIEPGKGQEDFLRACALVLRRHPDVTCLVVGDCDPIHSGFARHIEALATELGIRGQVQFTGWREDVPELLSVLDIFVHCPTTFIEGLGIATLEAMASGKPCVVYDNGALSEVVLDGVTGFVLPIGQVERMADRILALLEDEGLRQRMGLEARRRAEREYDIVKNVQALENVLESYASKTPAGA